MERKEITEITPDQRNEKKHIIVVGAGTSGLAAANRLRRKGYRVTIFEKEPKVGGKMHRIQEEGYTFDVGPTIVMMPDLYREVFKACGRDPEDYIPMTRVEPMMNLQFGDGESLEFTTDLVDLVKSLEAVSREDTQGYLAYLADIYQRYTVALRSFITRSYRKPRDFYNLSQLREGMKLKTLGDAYSSIGKFVKNENLKRALAFQTLYIGIDPKHGPSLYTIIPMIELLYGVWYMEGGMYRMAEQMARLFEEQGGILHLNTQIDRIAIEGGRATGVIVNGEHIAADYVVGSADFPYVMDQLMPEESRGKYTQEKIAKMEYSCSCFVLFLGVDKQYDMDAMHTIRFAKDFDQNIDDIFKEGKFPDDPSFYAYIPSVVDPSMAPEGHSSVYILVPVPELGHFDEWDEADIKRYRDQIISLVERDTPMKDLSQHIVYENRFTPRDYAERFNAHRGATFGLKPTLLQSNYWRPHNKFDHAEGLYFCGSSTHPGAGVPIVLESARLAVEELLKDDQG